MPKVKKKSTKTKTDKSSTRDSNNNVDGSTKKPVESLVSEKMKNKKKFGKEIDEIFEIAGKKKKDGDDESKQKEGAKGKGEVEVRVGEQKSKKRKGGGLDGALFEVGDGESEKKQNRRKTNDGMRIYSADELGISNPNAGGTPLCPFDCDCCF